MKDYTTIYVGLDVHKETIVASSVIDATGEVLGGEKFSNEPKYLRKYLRGLEKNYAGKIMVCYEAGCTGYALQREVEKWGYDCLIVAPSLIPKKPGSRHKTDRRDAEQLARLFYSKQLTFIHIPEEEDESVRDLLRTRNVLQREILKSRHYVLKFVLRKGFRYTDGKTNWTMGHWKWLKNLKFRFSVDQEIFNEYMVLLQFKLQRLEEINRRIGEVARSPRYSEGVRMLSAYKGLDTYSAMVLLMETGDFSRFPKAKHYMSFLGLVPSEYSSGNSHNLGHITKTGNSHCRHVLVQAAWNYCKTGKADHLRKRLSGLPAWVVSSVMNAHSRLFRKYWKLAREKSPKIAAIAIARELAGFIWGTMNRFELERKGGLLLPSNS